MEYKVGDVVRLNFLHDSYKYAYKIVEVNHSREHPYKIERILTNRISDFNWSGNELEPCASCDKCELRFKCWTE